MYLRKINLLLYGFSTMHACISGLAALFDNYNEHNNLFSMIYLLSSVPDLSQTSARKFLCWAVCLSLYSYICFHISKTEKIKGGIIGHWVAPRIAVQLWQVPKPSHLIASSFDCLFAYNSFLPFKPRAGSCIPSI